MTREHIVIFRTGQLFEIDMASNHLKEAGIPHFTQEELASGIRLAMPAAPATGPGVWWNLLVPKSWEERAREKLNELPFAEKQHPSVWDFQPTSKVKTGWRIYVALFVLIPLCLQIFSYTEYYFEPRPPTPDSVSELFRDRYPNIRVRDVHYQEFDRTTRGFTVTYGSADLHMTNGMTPVLEASFYSPDFAGSRHVKVLFKKSADGVWRPTPGLPSFLK